MITKKGYAGLVTQSGADIRTVKVDSNLNVGQPCKMGDNNEAKPFTTGDTADKFLGIYVEGHLKGPEILNGGVQSILVKGHVLVKIDKTDVATNPIKRNGPVFFDGAKSVFTANATKIAVPARFAVEGTADELAEIEVLPFAPVKLA